MSVEITAFDSNVPNEFAVDGLFQRSFGKTMPHGHIYMDVLGDVEAKSRFNEKTQKEIKSMEMEVKAALQTDSPLFATGTNFSGTSGSIPVLHPIWVDEKLYDKTSRNYPLASGVIPRVANRGIFATVVKRTALPTAAWRAQGAAQPSDASTYSMSTVPIKAIYSAGELGGLFMADNTWLDRVAMEKEAHMKAVTALLESTIISGNASTTPAGFSGFSTLVTTNTSNQSGNPIALSTIDTEIVACIEKNGDPDVIVTDYKTFYDVKAQLKPYISYVNPTSKLSAFGFDYIEYQGIPIVVSKSMPKSGAAREMHVWTVRKEGNAQLRVLQDMIAEIKPSDADSYRFLVKAYLTFVLIYEDWCSRIYGLE